MGAHSYEDPAADSGTEASAGRRASAERLDTLTEPGRLEVLEAHLMSVEDVDIFDDAVIKDLLKKDGAVIEQLRQELESDARFKPSV